MFVLSLLMGVVGVATAFQHNWWENRWSNSDTDSNTLVEGKAQFRNIENQWSDTDSNSIVGGPHFTQIDFRYPDWVVDPRPQCVQEGVFPHPRSTDCTWYYRCVARVGVPRYATFYFQCEPGTMFEDDLDQCVHPHSDYNCQGSVPTTPEPPVNACSPLQSTCKNYPVCGGGVQYLCRQEICTLTGVKLYCSRGQLRDIATGRCVDPPASCQTGSDTKCEAFDCKPVEVCTGSSRYTQTVCEKERCTRNGQYIGERPMCFNTNEVYDVDQKTCVPRPRENTCSCEFTATNCRNHDLCNPSGVRRLCDCNGCGSGMMYDPNTKVCIDKALLCPTLECVFRDSVCSCLNGMSLCTGCFMRGNLVPVSQFCKAQSNATFYHVEKDTCLYSDPGFLRASSGHCPRTRDSFGQPTLRVADPALQCSLRDNSIIRCWSDDTMI